MRRLLAVWLVVLSLFTCNASFSKGVPKIQVNFNNVDIKDFTKIISEALGKNVIMPPNLSGKVTIISPRPIPKSRLYNLYIAALDELGYQAVSYGSYIKIVRNNQAPQESSTVKLSNLDGGDRIVTSIIIPRHLNVYTLSGVVRQLLSPIARISFVRNSNAIVLTDKERNIHKVEEVIQRIDRYSNKFSLKTYQIRNTKASSVEKILKALFYKTFALDIANSVPIPGRDYYHIVSDDRTNTIFVIGTSNVINEVNSLLPKIDKKVSVKEGDIHVIRLNYAFSDDVAKVLSKLLKGKNVGLSGEVKLVSDKPTNSLIILCSPSDFNVVKGIVDNIDVKRPQVFVETQMAEMSMDRLMQLGVEWKFLSRGNYVPIGGNLYGSLPLQPGYPTSLPAPGGLMIGLAKWKNGIPDIGLLLSAYAKEGGVNVIATPQLLTLDNQPAEINISQNIPYSTGVKYDANNNPVISYDYKDVGIDLKITPHITASNEIKLKLYAKVEDITGYANSDQTAPETSKREVRTTVDVENGQTLVIGGLVKTKKVTTIERVPILGSIPVVGNLFRKTGHQIEKNNLLIFITPRVVRTQKEERRLTNSKITEYKTNLMRIKKERKGLTYDVKGFGTFEVEK